MEQYHLRYFTRDEEFPFFIQYGFHKEDLEMHTHDFYELVIVLNGTAIHMVNQEEYLIQKGDVFVLSGSIAHGYRNTSDFHICNVMFRPEYFYPQMLDVKRSVGFHALFVIEPQRTKDNKFQSRLRLSMATYEQIYPLLASMIHTITYQPFAYQTQLYAHFLQLITILCNEYTLLSEQRNDGVLNLARLVSFMENHFQEPMTVPQLAQLSGFSERHFTRLFQATYQISPLQYLLKIRIRHASSLLRLSTLSISEIAYACGFEDSNYFSRQFHKTMGYSPKEYRRITEPFSDS